MYHILELKQPRFVSLLLLLFPSLKIHLLFAKAFFYAFPPLDGGHDSPAGNTSINSNRTIRRRGW
jgi:hypothetical protein